MELLLNSIQTTLDSFDFSFCLVVNILTYTIIKYIDELNGDKKVSTWTKRIVLLCSILIVSVIYYFINNDLKLVINSAILAPVFWSWIFKPICIKFGVDYKQFNIE